MLNKRQQSGKILLAAIRLIQPFGKKNKGIYDDIFSVVEVHKSELSPKSTVKGSGIT